MSGLPPDIDSAVRARFRVTDSFQLPDGEVEYRVAYESASKGKFEKLCSDLGQKGFTPWLTGTREDCVLLIRKKQPPKPSVSRIPVILILVTVVSVALFAIIELEVYDRFAPEIPDYVVLASYGASMVAILAAHELGHRYVADRKKLAPPTPYFIPGFPIVTAFLPALGIVSLQREPAVNKDDVFDLLLAGPIAAFAVTLGLYVVSVVASVQSAIPLAGNQVINSFISVGQVNPSLIQALVDSVFASSAPAVVAGHILLSPIGDAAEAGFLLTFLSLLPMALFDGGGMAATILGERGIRVATYLSVLVLIVFDTPSYWAPAIVVLLFAGRQANVQVLDEVSSTSSAKRTILLLAVLLAFLCVPIPQNLATLRLG